MYPPSIQKLIELFSKFPTVGPRTASRFVFYLMNAKDEKTKELLDSISELKKNVKICPSCFNAYEPARNASPHSDTGGIEENLCQICSNNSRDKSLVCVIANETDLMTIENTKKYKGLYFVLGGTISALRKTDIEKLKIKELESRVRDDKEIKEIVLAINPTPDGEATTLYLERLIKNLPAYNGRVTRLGRGLPVGAELEYADEETLENALENRK